MKMKLAYCLFEKNILQALQNKNIEHELKNKK
jgi:hypothetical protein